jgi:hypothetical protein
VRNRIQMRATCLRHEEAHVTARADSGESSVAASHTQRRIRRNASPIG